MYVKPHPWDKYGAPNLASPEPDYSLDELEDQKAEILDDIDSIERQIEDLEDELSGLRSELSEVIVKIGSYIPEG